MIVYICLTNNKNFQNEKFIKIAEMDENLSTVMIYRPAERFYAKMRYQTGS